MEPFNSSITKQSCPLPTYGRTPPIEPPAKPLYSQVTSLFLVTVLSVEGTERGQTPLPFKSSHLVETPRTIMEGPSGGDWNSEWTHVA